ncbi:MAG: hypothetical protein MO846_08340 [Candidatus Devosia symbiotica]|nr:hypothetical protein [Candidatus Devosia symbiotica]
MRRAAGGHTKRTNLVQCLDPDDDTDAAARIANAVDWFSTRNLPPVFRITPLVGPQLRAALNRQGWRTINASYQFAMVLGPRTGDPHGQTFAVRDPVYLTI